MAEVALGALSSVDATPAVDTVCEGIIHFAMEQLNRNWPRKGGVPGHSLPFQGWKKGM